MRFRKSISSTYRLFASASQDGQVQVCNLYLVGRTNSYAYFKVLWTDDTVARQYCAFLDGPLPDIAIFESAHDEHKDEQRSGTMSSSNIDSANESTSDTRRKESVSLLVCGAVGFAAVFEDIER